MTQILSPLPVDNSVQTVPTVNYKVPASLDVLKAACTHASIAMPDTPLGAIWSCATKSGFDEGSYMVDSILVTDLIKIGFEKSNIHGIMAEHDHHSQTCPGLIKHSMCEAEIQFTDADLLNNPEAVDILCAFSSTAPSTTPFGLIWEHAFQAGTEVTQVQTSQVDISDQLLILSPPPPQNATLDWSEELVDEIQLMFPLPPQKYEPQDLSALQSSSPTPFSLLEQCLKCSYT